MPWSTLHPFRPAPEFADLTVEAQVELNSEGILLHYRLRSTGSNSLAGLFPSPKTISSSPKRSDGLWQATCFELFLGVENSPAYFEFNASPGGDWAWYAFDAYRAGMSSPRLTSFSEPKEIARLHEDARFETKWLIPTEALAEKRISEMAFSSVLARSGATSFWALRHPGTEPDFHLRDAFTLSLPRQ